MPPPQQYRPTLIGLSSRRARRIDPRPRLAVEVRLIILKFLCIRADEVKQSQAERLTVFLIF